MLERQTDDADWDGRDDEQPRQPLVGVAGHDPPRGDGRPDCPEEAGEDPAPVGPEEDQQRDRGRDVQRDDEREVGAGLTR